MFFSSRQFEEQQNLNHIKRLATDLGQSGNQNRRHFINPEAKRATRDSIDKKVCPKCPKTASKLLAVVSLIFLLSGLALLVFGIVRNIPFVSVGGALATVIAIIGIILVGILFYLSNKKEESKKNRKKRSLTTHPRLSIYSRNDSNIYQIPLTSYSNTQSQGLTSIGECNYNSNNNVELSSSYNSTSSFSSGILNNSLQLPDIHSPSKSQVSRPSKISHAIRYVNQKSFTPGKIDMDSLVSNP